jgi:TonB family protein
MLSAVRPVHLSLILHLTIVMGFILFTKIEISEREVIDVPIQVDIPKDDQMLTEVKNKPKVVLKSVNQSDSSGATTREVFGLNRKSYTDDSVGSQGIEAKRGNTLAKELDQTVLTEADSESLPATTEEYLVSEMPSLLSEVRPVYPKEAREKGIEGVVVMSVLVDDAGVVRQVSVIDGPLVFRSVALEAMKKFTFRPAKVDGKPVAVRIRYSLKFKLEF